MSPRDDYEQSFMETGQPVLYREKVVAKPVARLMSGMGAAFGLMGIGASVAAVVSAGLTGAVALGLPFLLLGAFMVFSSILFSVFRMAVTPRHVNIHFGWVRRQIPIGAITAVKVCAYEAFRYGKFAIGFDGVRRTWVGRAPSMRGVEIAYEVEGTKHVLQVGSAEPEQFAEAINRARAAACGDADAAGVRVDAEAGSEAVAGVRVAEDDEVIAEEEQAAEERVGRR